MSTQASYPTPYPDVNALVEELLASVRAILGNHFVAMYLYGSLATGDFDTSSDIDFVVVTDAELTDDLFAALQAMHAQIAAGDSHWAIDIEGTYIPLHALRRYDPANARYPHLEWGTGETLVIKQHDSDSLLQRHVLRERGLVLAGPPPQTLIDPVSADDLRGAMLDGLNEWWAPMLDDPSRFQSRGYQSYTVLTMCRILYTLESGTIVSKPTAARWAQETLGERWRPLIERALEGRHTPQLPAEPEDIAATMDLIRYTLERSRQYTHNP